jgi:two-component system NtrC family sensor kinase
MRRRWAGRFAAWPIRRKLLAMVLLPLVGVLPLLGLLLLVWGNAAFNRLLITKVRSDLAVAHGYFERVLGEVAASTQAVADSRVLYAALTSGVELDRAALRALMIRSKTREGLDFIALRDADGRLLLADFDGSADPSPPASWADGGPGGSGLPGPSDQLAGAAQPDSKVMAAIAVLLPAEQGLLSPALRARVVVPLLATRNAQPSTRHQEDRAMVVRAAAPVRAADGRLLAWVQAGVLLNRNLPFIDHINRIVYPAGALPFGSQGTATLFLDDVRISTNVRVFGAVRQGGLASADVDEGEATIDRPGDQRAIGTRVSQTVRDAVLDRGETWLDRAFVVNDWYVSAYQPLLDAAGRRVGMLYVGYLERPFTVLKYSVLAGIGLVFFAVMLLAALLSARWARLVFRPLEQMAHTMLQVEAGRPAARVGPVASGDEIGALAGHFDHLLDTLADKTEALQRWNALLDAKVAERTRALEAAQSRLLRAEKMASVGQLTAGIAHEINNPIAVIQGNLDLVRELLGTDAGRVRPELRLVDEQIERMRLIVTQLLQFARPNEFAGYVESIDAGQALDDGLVLIRHLLAPTRITVERDFRASRSAAVNRQELQQVLVNLLSNAVQAMPEGGRLTLSTRDWQSPSGAPGVQIGVADTGAGLSADLLAKLFQPFVTRKREGTGLGLWISRGIVERYGGDLRAANRPDDEGGGARMTVDLLTEPNTPATQSAHR